MQKFLDFAFQRVHVHVRTNVARFQNWQTLTAKKQLPKKKDDRTPIAFAQVPCASCLKKYRSLVKKGVVFQQRRQFEWPQSRKKCRARFCTWCTGILVHCQPIVLAA